MTTFFAAPYSRLPHACAIAIDFPRLAVARRRDRRTVDRLSHGARPDRSEEPGTQTLSGGLVGNLHRDLPAAQWRAGSCGEADAETLPATRHSRSRMARHAARRGYRHAACGS